MIINFKNNPTEEDYPDSLNLKEEVLNSPALNGSLLKYNIKSYKSIVPALK